MADGQFDECDLTLRDVERIQEAFVGQLLGMYHQRVAYPQNKVVELESRRERTAGHRHGRVRRGDYLAAVAGRRRDPRRRVPRPLPIRIDPARRGPAPWRSMPPGRRRRGDRPDPHRRRGARRAQRAGISATTGPPTSCPSRCSRPRPSRRTPAIRIAVPLRAAAPRRRSPVHRAGASTWATSSSRSSGRSTRPGRSRRPDRRRPLVGGGRAAAARHARRAAPLRLGPRRAGRGARDARPRAAPAGGRLTRPTTAAAAAQAAGSRPADTISRALPRRDRARSAWRAEPSQPRDRTPFQRRTSEDRRRPGQSGRPVREDPPQRRLDGPRPLADRAGWSGRAGRGMRARSRWAATAAST